MGKYFVDLENSQSSDLSGLSDQDDRTIFGLKITLFVAYLIGFSEGLTHLATIALYYLFKDDLHLSPAELSAVHIIPSIPYIIKPSLAYVTDCMPIFGTRRKHYLIIAGILQAMSYFALAILPITLFGTLLSLLCIQVTVVFCLTIAEALIIESMGVVKDSLSNFVGIRSVASILVAYFSVWLLENYSKGTVFILTGLFPLSITISSIFLREAECAPTIHEGGQINRLFTFLKNPAILYSSVYVLALLAGPDYFEVLFYYLTNELGYSPTFVGTMRLAYGVAMFVGVLIYKYYLKNTGIRTILFWTSIIGMPLYVSPALLTSGISRSIGIPDNLFILSGTFLVEATFEVQILPILNYASKITPPGLEASVFSALTSVRSLGYLVSKLNSSVLTYFMGITSTEFKNVTIFIIICAIFSFFSIFLITYVPTEEEVDVLMAKYSMNKEMTSVV